ncbi:MAG: hypothetical protein KC503_02625 [Myxococcales bacterium]|nr:hypothetical protein [Myxococcales bacterium]
MLKAKRTAAARQRSSERSPKRARRPSKRLTIFLSASLAFHLVLALLALLRPEVPYAAAPAVVDLELVGKSEGRAPSDADQKHTPADRADKNHPTRERALSTQPSPRVATVAPRVDDVMPPRSGQTSPTAPRAPHVRRRRNPEPAVAPRIGPTARSSGTPRPTAKKDGEASCLLSMRGCKSRQRGATPKATPSRAAKKASTQRFATFFPRDRPRRLESKMPQARVSSGGIVMARYADGGRLMRALGKRSRPPGYGETRLLSLASRRIGGTFGRKACDVYRNMPRGQQRLLVVMVDTSGSVVSKRRAPAALVCAAGAVLSALDRGYRVALVNFSTRTRFLKPTRDREVLYSVMSSLQGGMTRLPSMKRLELPAPSAVPHDYVMITDGAIENLKQVLPGYGVALRRNASNRGLLFVLGEATKNDGVAAISQVGFRANNVEKGDTSAFVRYAADALRKLL